MKTKVVCIASASMLVGCLLLAAQDSPFAQRAIRPTESAPTVTRTPVFSPNPLNSPQINEQRLTIANRSPLAAAMRDLKQAESDEDKQAATAKVKEALEKEYDAFLAQNEKQLEELEQRLNNLRDQLDRRKKAKDKMVELRLQMLVSEADGLGWPSRSSSSLWRNNSQSSNFGQLYDPLAVPPTGPSKTPAGFR